MQKLYDRSRVLQGLTEEKLCIKEGKKSEKFENIAKNIMEKEREKNTEKSIERAEKKQKGQKKKEKQSLQIRNIR